MMEKKQAYKDFTERLALLIGKYPELITTTLSNIFTMRLIGNKTHGDLAEIAIAEFINQYMYDFRSIHVGKDLYRAKSHEEDITIVNEISQLEFPVSLKAYGDGPLQSSTDKNFRMFPRLEQERGDIVSKKKILNIFQDSAFVEFSNINVLPLIYDEQQHRCNILVFDYDRVMEQTARIVRESAGRGRTHPVYRFYDADGDYVCEVRYGDARANALQRGLWTHTKSGPQEESWIITFMSTLSLFPKIAAEAPQTEGVKYAGSKLKLLPHILQMVKKVDAKTVLDGFSGTTRVSQALAKSGYRVLCNDISAWSEVFGICYLLNNQKREAYRELIDHLNALPPHDGWFTENYGGLPNDGRAIQADGLKKPWQIHNTRKLDAIRAEIDRLALSKVERAVALTSLILALDRVDSTLGHYASYLQEWSPRSYNHLILDVPRVFVSHEQHEVWRRDIIDLLPDVSVDLAYFDPPYGSNNEKMPPSRVRYASYYHLWTTICLHDEPNIVGKAKRREDASDTVAASIFEDFRRDENDRFVAVKAIERLIQQTRAKWIVLSYSSGGRATADELNRVIRENGILLEVVEVDYKKNVMAEMKWTNEWIRDSEQPNREFLFLIEKR